MLGVTQVLLLQCCWLFYFANVRRNTGLVVAMLLAFHFANVRRNTGLVVAVLLAYCSTVGSWHPAVTGKGQRMLRIPTRDIRTIKHSEQKCSVLPT